MAEGEDKDSKTEEPTEKKIRDAVDKGNVPFSREVPVFASTLGMLVFLVFFLPSSAASRFAETLRDLFEQSDGWRLTTGGDALALFQLLFFEAGGIMLPAFALLMGFGIAASVLQNMPSPVLDRIQPKLERISIAKGFGRIYGAKGMVEFAKSIFKIVVVSLSWQSSCRRNFSGRSISCSWTRILVAPDMARMAGKVIVVVLICTATVAILDVLWTRYSWHLDLKMSKQDDQGRAEAIGWRSDHQGASALAGSRPRPAPDDRRGAARDAGDRQSDPFRGGPALCARRGRRTGGHRQGPGSDCPEDPRSCRSARDSGFRGSSARTLHVCASLSR
jgi:hypothetical protein